MKKQHYFFLCSLLLLLVVTGCQNGYSRYVNPLVGTDFHGHCGN